MDKKEIDEVVALAVTDMPREKRHEYCSYAVKDGCKATHNKTCTRCRFFEPSFLGKLAILADDAKRYRDEAAELKSAKEENDYLREKIHELEDLNYKIISGKLTAAWIPVSNRTPERNAVYLVTLKGTDENTVDFCMWNGWMWGWSAEEKWSNCDQVIAWSELPEAWREEK